MEFKLSDVVPLQGPRSNWRIVAGVVGAMTLVALSGGYWLVARETKPTPASTPTPAPNASQPAMTTPPKATNPPAPTTSKPATPTTTPPTASTPAPTNSSTSRSSSAPAATPTATVKTINQGGATQLLAKSTGDCRYNAPDDWAAISDGSGTGIDLLKADKSMYAGWSISPIDRSMQAYYGDRFGDPDTSNLSMIDYLLTGGGYTADAQWSGDNQAVSNGLFTVRSWKSSQKTGVMIYHIYPNPDVSVAYIDSMYVAATDTDKWKSEGGTAVAVAVSIRCTAKLRPASSAGTTGSSGGSKDSADGISSSDYNAQLGTETVHDPQTGENFTVDHATNYNTTGPDGPGYYRSVGNDLRKLDTGMSY